MLRLLAAFWAADITDEKKPVFALATSTGGVNGFVVTLESLLGPMVVEAEELLLWAFTMREAGEPSAAALGVLQVAALLSRMPPSAKGGWVGDGGVLTIAGAPLSKLGGGVKGGRALFSTSVVIRDRPLGGATLAAVGGSIVGRSAGGSVAVAAEECRGLSLESGRMVMAGG